MPSNAFSGAVTGPHGPAVSFSVDDVVPASKSIWTQRLDESLKSRFQRKVLLLPAGERPVVNPIVDEMLRRKTASEPLRSRLMETVSETHPLIDAVHTAFSQHWPLTLSPDCIWLVIAQGFSHHVAENRETLRSRLVRHEGRQKLVARVLDLTLSSFEGAIAGFSTQIREASDPVLHETLICDFSTTTPDVRTASEVVLMDTYSSYFTYVLDFVCGIPQVTLTGTPEDWQRIRARVEIFEAYELGWWVRRLRPILDELILTSEGKPSQAFWQLIYKPRRAYTKNTVTGWIADLFPYLGDAPSRRRNHVFQYERDDWALPVEQGVKTFEFGEPGANKGASGFPSGLSSAPLELRSDDRLQAELDLVAGFLAVEQSPQDLSLSPVISWSVTERAPLEPILTH